MMEELLANKNMGLVSGLCGWIDDGVTAWKRKCKERFWEDY